MLMLSFVVSVTLGAARYGPVADSLTLGTSGPAATQPGSTTHSHPAARLDARPGAWAKQSAAMLDQRLAKALHPVVARANGNLAIGIVDTTTGAAAVYNGQSRFQAASIEKADILAALLLDDQRDGIQLTQGEAASAAPMIESNDATSANVLYAMVDGETGLSRANAELGLTHTSMDSPGGAGLCTTTVSDQLQLLAELTTARSPLTAASRDYELALMENVEPGQTWGVPAAAVSGTSFAVKDGWFRERGHAIADSIGIVNHDGQQLLIVVFTNSQYSVNAGINADAAAAAIAAEVVTSTR
jgi:beta-lactamase class A